ncbi:MAG: YIP1 family protein [Dehalococcoidia bacterium]|nr:YIP1 family protein [Dehalococcoidia bacterium]
MLWERMLRAARLERGLYEEVERDANATSQALLVVVIVAVLSGIGSGLKLGLIALIGGIVVALVAWAIWSLITYWVGTTFFGGKATYGELLRCVGFANTPNALGLFAFVPGLGGLIVLIGSIWALVAMIVGIREALDVTTGQAIITAVIGWVVIMIVMAVLALFGLGAGIGLGMMA